MGKKKDTIKVKRKCCHSKPACKSCPIVVLREALRESKAAEAEKSRKRQRKKAKKASLETTER
ncbi:hypothetical protein SAMN04487820_101361 [Actinopolyspora mzabensis]|uniref:Uncharacterized protein n=1 Tax=Actinopolyspora mzabensis TaxID=995066 RepID=A0A1G8VVJ4_ACTMZ|nr:hypothetical protein SAMN04487820_101361 [Actinopolyspora mzabensis]